MTSIKLIDEGTDLTTLEMRKMDWDVMVYEKPYQVVRIEGYVHTIGGLHGENDLWMYPRDEALTYENLIQYNCDDCGVCWGIKYEPHNYITHKWDESESHTYGGATITRNGEDFYFCRRGIDEARVLINRFKEHPLSLNSIGWKEKAIGRKVWWRSEPAIITSFIDGQACVILEPDGIEKFTTPAEFFDPDGLDYYADGDVKAEIFNAHIWWFRE